VWDVAVTELLKLLPVFFGVFLAFSLDRAIDWLKDRRNKQGLLSRLHTELGEIKEKLTGEGHLHFPDIWDSAISSGQIRLLDAEQVRRLSSVYRDVKAVEYEARRVRDLAEEIRVAKAKGHVPNELNYLWSQYSALQRNSEEKLREKVEELLKEKWWENSIARQSVIDRE
jgi:hypothetical protein